MKTQIKKRGDSKIIVLSKEFLKFHDLNENNWVDLSDIIKVKPEIKIG